MSATRLTAAAKQAAVQLEEENDVVPSGKYRTARFIFVASLYFKMVGVTNPTRKELTEVNNKFGLVKRDSSLLFPAAISNIIWKQVDLVGLFKSYTTRAEPEDVVVDKVLSQAPSWIKYGGGNTIRSDIRAVFECVRAG